MEKKIVGLASIVFTAPNPILPSAFDGFGILYVYPYCHKQGEIADKNSSSWGSSSAKFIVENFLEDAVCFNEVRNTFGYTGTYKITVYLLWELGMGMPSISIYARELIVDYGVKKLDPCGERLDLLNEDVHVRELTAQAAATNSNIIRNDWPQYASHKLQVLIFR